MSTMYQKLVISYISNFLSIENNNNNNNNNNALNMDVNVLLVIVMKKHIVY